jgi:CRISPR/Cas system CSM-associated protein Csm5 (group 7 of RAMP superfamily)
MKINLTKDEVRVIDNELFVTQRKLAYLNLQSVDQATPTKEEMEYKKIVENLRVKLGKLMNRDAVGRFIA